MGISTTAVYRAGLAALVTALMVADASAAYKTLAHCSGPVQDRSGETIREIFDKVGFQPIARGKLPWHIRERAWTYPTAQTDVRIYRAFGVISTPLERLNGGHEGVDISGRARDAVYAAAKGKVVFLLYGCPTGRERMCGNGWGNHVVISHGEGVYTRYAHLRKISVAFGANVAAGAVLGELGSSGLSTGPHLHFEVGTRQGFFEPCLAPQNMDRVYDPRELNFKGQ